jgi:dihydroorotate dehydrogenase (fumarate)
MEDVEMPHASRRINWLGSLLVAVAVALPAFEAGSLAHAADAQPLAIEPASTGGGIKRTSFNYTLSPGDSQTDSVVVSNLGDTTQNVRVYLANAFTTASGKVGVKANEAAKEDPVGWVNYTSKLGNGVIQIAAKTSKTIPFTITVPPDAPPGDYAVGLAAVPVVDPLAAQQGQNNLTVVTAVATLLRLNVDGPLLPVVQIANLAARATPALVPGTDGGTTSVSFQVVNAGNQSFKATVNITETDALGNDMYTYPPIQLNEMLPGSAVPVDVGWPDAPSWRGAVRVEVTTDTTATVVRKAAFWAVPWGFVGIIVGVLILLELLRRLRKRRRSVRA